MTKDKRNNPSINSQRFYQFPHFVSQFTKEKEILYEWSINSGHKSLHACKKLKQRNRAVFELFLINVTSIPSTCKE